ncbi:MAG: O-antigen ligase family protein [Endomicrobia bacterium]|nr:O-antigen ligase family protein [Endomicrobiia bacterium]MDW8056219.1 O-antigen ligase family protein [Elusimicrobiota bacterium]
MNLKTILGRLLESLLFLFMFFLPISRSAQAIGIFLCLIVWLILIVLGKGYRDIIQNKIILFCLLFVSSLFISTLVNGVNIVSLDGLMKILSCVVLTLVVYQGIENIQCLKKIVVALVVSTSVVSVYGILQYFTRLNITNSDKVEIFNRVHGMLDTNSFAGILEAAIMYNFSLVFFYMKNLVFWLCFLVMLICLGLTMTRGAWFGVVVGFLIISLVVKKSRWALLFVGLVLILLLTWPHGRERIIRTLKLETERERMLMWKHSIKMFIENPLFGNGPNSFWKSIQHLESNIDKGHKHCHNIYLGLAAECGIFSVVTFLIFSLFTLYTAIRLLKISFYNFSDYLILGAVGYIVSFLIHGFVDYTLYGETGYLYGFSVGIITLRAFENKNKYENKI